MCSTVDYYRLEYITNDLEETITMSNNVYVEWFGDIHSEWFDNIHIYTYNCPSYRDKKPEDPKISNLVEKPKSNNVIQFNPIKKRNRERKAKSAKEE